MNFLTLSLRTTWVAIKFVVIQLYAASALTFQWSDYFALTLLAHEYTLTSSKNKSCALVMSLIWFLAVLLHFTQGTVAAAVKQPRMVMAYTE